MYGKQEMVDRVKAKLNLPEDMISVDGVNPQYFIDIKDGQIECKAGLGLLTKIAAEMNGLVAE